MGSHVKLDPRLDAGRVAWMTWPDLARAEDTFLSSRFLLVDGVPWNCDMQLIRTGLVKKRRGFKSPFKDREPPLDVMREVGRLGVHANELFIKLFPSFSPTDLGHSLRPMITGPEPLHFDTYPGVEKVTAFVNVSTVPRVYCISYSFEQLVDQMPGVMSEVVSECDGDVDNLSYVIRDRTRIGKAPLGADAPRHRIELAPGAIWFFNAKTVSHEVVYGEGASGHAWDVPGHMVPTQKRIVEALVQQRMMQRV